MYHMYDRLSFSIKKKLDPFTDSTHTIDRLLEGQRVLQQRRRQPQAGAHRPPRGMAEAPGVAAARLAACGLRPRRGGGARGGGGERGRCWVEGGGGRGGSNGVTVNLKVGPQKNGNGVLLVGLPVAEVGEGEVGRRSSSLRYPKKGNGFPVWCPFKILTSGP